MHIYIYIYTYLYTYAYTHVYILYIEESPEKNMNESTNKKHIYSPRCIYIYIKNKTMHVLKHVYKDTYV